MKKIFRYETFKKVNKFPSKRNKTNLTKVNKPVSYKTNNKDLNESNEIESTKEISLRTLKERVNNFNKLFKMLIKRLNNNQRKKGRNHD